MKIVKAITVAALISSSFLYAQTDGKKSQMAKDMGSMLGAMSIIQTGGFYNNSKMMKKGVIQLKEGLTSLRAANAKDYLPHDQEYANRFAKKRADMIAMYADDLVTSLDDKDMDSALENYSLIMKQCSSCHLRIRSW
ncbi:MAG: hypothetical protein U9Q62_02475 [Campylobacterota bacterium]|nr:hypothetical protein [Campylobacterota bacterium]